MFEGTIRNCSEEHPSRFVGLGFMLSDVVVGQDRDIFFLYFWFIGLL